MKSGFYPGSFDPPTLGHQEILTRAMQLVDRLVIGIGVNATKTPIFNHDERVEMLTLCLSVAAKSAQCKLEIKAFNGLVVDAAREFDAPLIIRGLRNGADFDYENQMIAMNRKMAPEIETICLGTAPETGFISSTLVRQIAQMGGDFTAFVPPEIVAEIANKIKDKY